MAQHKITFGTFWWLVLLLVGLGILRSAITTRLDGFTIDEAYHIAAGVSYLKYRDFRINPEQPPLVKVWVGSVIAATGFHMDPLRQFADKPDERTFTQQLVFQKNDPDSVQRRARTAMFVLNGLLLICLTFAIKKVFSAGVALGTLLFLVIDPTVAAHWPVVMMDLPVALCSATAIVLATRAFRDWLWRDLALCSFFLGLALTAKHSAPVVLLTVGAIGTVMAIRLPLIPTGDTRWRRFLKVAGVMAGALVVLWGSYLFHYSEARTGHDAFNRPLADKISDVDTTMYHSVLTTMAATRVVPRAYLWGFADTIRAGMEGRPYPQLIFGRVYVRRGPKYFFPAMLAVKLPIGLSILALLGLALFIGRRLPADWNLAAAIILAAAIVFLLVLARGATYAGIRHALPVVVLLSIFAGLFAQHAIVSHSRKLHATAAIAYLLAILSAVPIMRPWEYFNELVGTRNAYKYFSDEGVDLGQRTKEMVAYYRRVLKPTGQTCDVMYFTSEEEMKGRDMQYLGRDRERDRNLESQPERSGTIFAGIYALMHSAYWDSPALRAAVPVARYGNLFIYQGTFHLPGSAAGFLYWDAQEKLYAAKPDVALAEKDLQMSVDMDPAAFFAHIELANLLLNRGARDEALREYSQALRYAPADPQIRQSIEAQIQRVSSEPPGTVRPLRNPVLE